MVIARDVEVWGVVGDAMMQMRNIHFNHPFSQASIHLFTIRVPQQVIWMGEWGGMQVNMRVTE